MPEADTPKIHSVACESCRTKKCKCDRNLPLCKQCEKSGTTCIYPQAFKRGFPEGYMNGLEQRLLLTELALFETLSLLDSHQPEGPQAQAQTSIAFTQHNAQQTKANRMQEWARFPLNTSDQRLQWWEYKISELSPSPHLLRRGTDSPSPTTTTDHGRNPLSLSSHGHFFYQGPSLLQSQDDPSQVEPEHSAMMLEQTSTRAVNIAPITSSDVGMTDIRNWQSNEPVAYARSPHLQNSEWNPAAPSIEAIRKRNTEGSLSQDRHVLETSEISLTEESISKAQSLSSQYSKKFF